jgi:hypothetical protein
LADVDCIGVGQRVHREAVRQQDRLGTAKSFNGRFERRRSNNECRLGPEWNDQAKKLNKDDWVNMQGRISNKPARLGSEFKGDHEVLVTRGHLRLETALKNLKRTVEHIVSRMSSLETKRPK